MYHKMTLPETVKNVCTDLQLPWNFCQLLSSDRTVCLVNEEWIKGLHMGYVVPVMATDDLDTCQVERLLSRSCDKIPHPWMKVTIKAIAKSDSLYHKLPGQHSQKQWSCGSLFEFMSHITKENMTNLWSRAQCGYRGSTSQHAGARFETCLPFTDVVRELLHRLKPLTYVNLLPEKDSSSDKRRLSATSSDPTPVSNITTGSCNSFSTGSSSRLGSFYTTCDMESCYGIVPVDVVIESQNYLYVVQPYYPFTLQDVVTFSPTILETSHAKPLFIIYQLLCAMHALHSHGLRMGDIRVSDIVMNKNMWLMITSPRLNSLKAYTAPVPRAMSNSLLSPSSCGDTVGTDSVLKTHDVRSLLSDQPCGSSVNSERLYEAACDFMKAEQFKYYEISMLDSIVDAWVHRHITNFQYLMILNHLAGRRMADPNNHPVLPWILDFTGPDSGFRDLTKSKFRLNKGDSQLDFMYSGMHEVSDSGDHIPHHVSDILSDITYYVYKARRTPKHILCAHVRANWVPHEYPVSMQRLQDWTPDECIPEFFTDPSIFDSIHEDLPDLEIPPWSKNTVDFVIRHLAALESDHVSAHLHHWIDLTFGYKLSGVAAVKAKNVHLHLVDQHTHLTSQGAAQLFQQPHPQRRSQQTSTSSLLPRITRGMLNTQLLTYGMPTSEADTQYADASFDSSELGRVNQAAIHLPRNYNPLLELDQCEALEEFKARALHVRGSKPSTDASPSHARYQDDGITEDMVTLTCLICEMFLDAKLRMQDSRPPLWKRVETIRRLCFPDPSAIQRPLQKFVCDMFQSLEVTEDKRMYLEAIFPDGSPPPTPGYLIQPYSDLIPFPPYFSELYTCLNKIEEKTLEIELLKKKRMTVQERASRRKQLEREKVPLLGTFLWKYQSYVGPEGMGIILPYIQDLLQNENTTVQAAWSLFDSTTRELGPLDSAKQFLPFLTSLFSGEVSSAKHIKLYHRSFLMQLIVRLGLDTFLTYFSTLLVEAVAGYKDFQVSSHFHAEELLEEFDQQSVLKLTPDSSKPMVWPGVDFANIEDETDDVPVSEETDTVDDSDVDRSHLEKLEGDLEDQMSLDGTHVLLDNDDDGLHLERIKSQGDASERDSLGSESSDDRMEVAVIKRRAHLLEDQSGGSAYDNTDQHSIHSISHIMGRSATDSLSTQDELEPSSTFLDAERAAPAEDSTVSSDTTGDSLYSGKQVAMRNIAEPGSICDSKDGGHHQDVEVFDNNYSAVESQAEAKSVQNSTQQTTHELKCCGETSVNTDAGCSQYVDLDSILESSSEENNQEGHVKVAEHRSDDVNGGIQHNQMLCSSSRGDHVDAQGLFTVSSMSEHQQRSRTGSDMVRSETEDIMFSLSSDSSGHITNIRDVAADSVKWLSHKLGPVLASKFVSRNLVRMLALCYLGQDQLQVIEPEAEDIVKTSRAVVGDKNSQKVLDCLGFTVILYGEQVILIQCLTSILDMIKMAQKRLSPRAEGGLIASVILLSFLIPYLSDTNLMNLLEESIIYKCINPVLAIVTTTTTSFPSGALARSALCHKLIDLLYILGLRLGLEMTRKYLTCCMQQLFDMFSVVHGGPCPSLENAAQEPSLEYASYGSDESYLTIKMDPLTHQYKIGSPISLRSLKSSSKRSLNKIHSLSSVATIDDRDDYVDPRSPSSTAEKCAQELRSVFSPELAQACYIPLCRIFGSIHMEEHLHNEDLIRRLCSQHDSETDVTTPTSDEGTSALHHAPDDLLTPTEEIPTSGGIGSNVTLIGNRIQLNEMVESSVSPTAQSQVGQFGRGYRHAGILGIRMDDLRSTDMEQNKSRHLRGHWLAYWERELGLHERDTMFNFMHIDLQTYLGHTSSIRSLHTMDTENCFISACKDKTVRLWSINSNGDGMNKQHCQYCYSRHKKSVFSVAYVDSMRLVASCDSTVHVWDPYTGVAISQLESAKYPPVIALTALPSPSTLVAMATTESSLRFLDMRTSKYTHDFRCSVGSTGLIRCVVVSPDSNWVAVGFSTGFIYILDVNSGMFLHYWKAHDAEILQLKAYGKSRLLSSAFDQTIKLWNVDTGQEVCPTKSQAESVHCLAIYRDQLLTATTANRISVYASVTDSTAFASSKLKSFKGVLTCMSVLPLNKALLLGADNGTIRLMA